MHLSFISHHLLARSAALRTTRGSHEAPCMPHTFAPEHLCTLQSPRPFAPEHLCTFQSDASSARCLSPLVALLSQPCRPPHTSSLHPLPGTVQNRVQRHAASSAAQRERRPITPGPRVGSPPGPWPPARRGTCAALNQTAQMAIRRLKRPPRQPRRLSCYSRGAQERREGRRGPDAGCAAPTPEPDRRTRRWWEWLQGRAAHDSISASSVSPAAMRTAASASRGTSRNRVRTYAAQPAAQARLRTAVWARAGWGARSLVPTIHRLHPGGIRAALRRAEAAPARARALSAGHEAGSTRTSARLSVTLRRGAGSVAWGSNLCHSTHLSLGGEAPTCTGSESGRA